MNWSDVEGRSKEAVQPMRSGVVWSPGKRRSVGLHPMRQPGWYQDLVFVHLRRAAWVRCGAALHL